jgi:hypothetical protein
MLKEMIAKLHRPEKVLLVELVHEGSIEVADAGALANLEIGVIIPFTSTAHGNGRLGGCENGKRPEGRFFSA